MKISTSSIWNLMFLCLATKAYGGTPCTGGNACSVDKPYCSDAGCVYQCPLFTNLSECVFSCGDWFVINSTWPVRNVSCYLSCPTGWYYREQPRAVGMKTVIDNVCTEHCDFNEFEMGETCVRACPSEFTFIDGNKCIQSCPDGKKYQMNLTFNSIIYRRCFDSCPVLVDGIYCTNQCKVGQYVFNSTCVETCPNTYPLKFGTQCLQTCPETHFYQENNTCLNNCTSSKPFYFPSNRTCGEVCAAEVYLTKRRGVLHCEDRCGKNEMIYNHSCLSTCSDPIAGETVLFAFNGTCVAQCPDGSLANDDENGRYCTDTCSEEKFLYKQSCVDLCPSSTYMVNSQCLDSCPSKLHYSCRVHKGQTCGEICPPSSEGYFHDICVDKCPSYSDDNSCVQICPSLKYTSNDMCVTECPSSLPLMQATQIGYRKCTRYCYYCFTPYGTEDQSELRTTCVAKCREGLVIFNSTCRQDCPNDHRYLVNGTCQEEKCQNLMYEMVSYNLCTDHCKADEYVNNGTCVKQCPDGSYISNNTCHYGPCATRYEYKKGSVTICTDNCTSHGFVSNRSCVDTCPYVVFNNTCTETCPSTHPLVSNETNAVKKISFLECVNECNGNLSQFNGSCVKYCPETLLMFNRLCIRSCPTSHPYRQSLDTDVNINSLTCVSTCTDPYPLKDKENLTCVAKCPQNANFIHSNICKEECPAGYLQFTTAQGIVCTRKCPARMLEFNGTCVEKCPSGMYSHSGTTCVYNCTGDLPFGLKQESWLCIASCENDKYFKDGECIYSFDCKEPYFIYLKECISECPKYYVWDGSCSSLLTVYTPVFLAVFVGFIVIMFCRQLLLEYFSVLRMVLCGRQISCCTTTVKDERASHDTTKVEDDTVPLLESNERNHITEEEKHENRALKSVDSDLL